MDELLAEPGREPLNPRRGDIVEGIVVHWSGSVLIVDVGAKSEGVVHYEEMRSLTDTEREALKTGDAVHVFVTDSESEGGSLELSIDRARGEQGWHELQRRFDENEVFDARVTGSNKGGLLVNVEGVNAQFLWSLLEGVGAAERAGVQLVNPNGLLNLIGWVQSNDGRVVPHPDFHYPDTVSPEAPLLLQIPTDLLRSVRAEAVQRLDRHHAVDGRGRRHELMRTLPDGVFETESSRRVYGSVSSLARGELTCVYEGSANLWVIFAAPNISDSTVESALFRMIGVWLHRIGAVFDAKGVIAGEGESSTAYLEFLDHVESLDGRPAEELGGKPSAADLGPLCGVEGLPEEKACKAVFEVGFLDGFRIAENVAERLVVRTLIRAYLRLCGVEDEDAEVRAMESLVVSNDEARDFHIFQPDDYHGYVRGSLPGRLVEHESVDQGTARIGLASRGGPVPGSRSIEGRSACTEFLAEVVDSLVGDLTARLAVFDRRPALTRLALNCEKADAEERRWTMTSAAILGLHGSGLFRVSCGM